LYGCSFVAVSQPSWGLGRTIRKAWYPTLHEPMAVKEEIVKMREPTLRNQGKILGFTVDAYLLLEGDQQALYIYTRK
jgi:hypothetical protein